MNKEQSAVDDCDTCFLYVRLKNSTKETLNDVLLESKLNTKILGYDIIRTAPTPAFRIKIAKALLHNALTHARAHDCVADIWGGGGGGGTLKPSGHNPMRAPRAISTASTTQQSLTITCWNCRVWSTGASYLEHMVHEGSDVVVLSEHWLWPYTYLSGNSKTIVNYILADVEASSCIESCEVLESSDLNTSDHLALSVSLSCDILTQFANDPNWIRIDWAKAEKSGAMLNQKEVSDRLKPFTQRSRGNVDHIDREIGHVAWLIIDAARKTLPVLKSSKAHRFRDRTLSQLCAKSKEAWRVWSGEGRPSSGPLYDAKCALRREVRQRIKYCSAMEERRRVQRRETLFRANSHLRFRIPQKRGKSKCTRLGVNGALICDPSQLLQAWTQHFQSLAQSQEEKNPALKESIKQSSTLLSATFQKEEVFLDVAFCTEEVEHTQNKMKLKKSAGPDNLTAEHLKFGGQTIITWLTEILNSIVDVERIP